MLSAFMYGCETWTIYGKHMRQMESFYKQCLPKFFNIRWQDHVPNTKDLRRCGLPSIQALLIKAQLRWAGHVMLKDDSCIPKAMAYG